MNKKSFLLISFCLLTVFYSEPIFAQPSKSRDNLLFTGAIGVQTYTYRNSGKDPIKILDTIQSLGITEMEGGIRGLKPDGTEYSREEIAKLMADRGIKVVSVGAGFPQLQTDEGIQRVIANAKAAGASYIICAWINFDKVFKLEDANKAIEVFSKAGKIIKDSGLTFAYHCHGYEFQPYEDGTLWDYMAKKMPAEYVSFEIDILWAFFGGQDPAKLILKYGSRCKLMHVKDLRKGIQGNLTGLTDPMNDVAVGEGQLDIPAIMKAAKKVGIKHYFIEDESPLHGEQMPRSIKYLRSLKD